MESIFTRAVRKAKWELYGKGRYRKYQRYLKENVRNRNFSIISSNCWGGNVYTDMDLPYETPTAGLFFYAPCYLAFISDLRKSLFGDIVEINTSRYAAANTQREATGNYYPIGLLNGKIEIHFLHYPTIEAAVEKWRRRSERVNFDNLFFAFNDKELCTPKQVREFEELPYKNKVFFSARPYPGYQSVVFIPEYKDRTEVEAADTGKWVFLKHFDLVSFLNGQAQLP